MAMIGGAMKYVGKKVGGAIAKDVIQHEVERHPVGGQALGMAQMGANMTGRRIPGMKQNGSVIGRSIRAKGIAGGLNQQFADVRQGNIRERNKTMTANKMASLGKAYEDMIELKKEAAAAAAASHNGGGGKETIGDVAKKHGAKIGVTLGTIAAVGGARKLMAHYQSEKVWKDIVSKNPDMNTEEHRENFEVLKKFSPSIASNKTTARSYLQRAAHAGMMPHEFVKDLTAIEKTRDDTSLGGLLGKKAALSKYAEEKEESSLKDKLKRIGKSGLKGGAVGGVAGAAGANPAVYLKNWKGVHDAHKNHDNVMDPKNVGDPNWSKNLGEAAERMNSAHEKMNGRTNKMRAIAAGKGGVAGAAVGATIGAGRQALKEWRSK